MEDEAQVEPPLSRPSLLRPFANRDFGTLGLAEGLTTLGSQFYRVLLPWLLFRLQGSNAAFSNLLVASAVPHLLLLPLGGALADRFSPRLVLLIGSVARAVLMGGLAVAALSGSMGEGLLYISEALLYIMVITFALIEALVSPSGVAIIPRLVETEQLESGNAAIQTINSLVNLFAPALIGMLAVGTIDRGGSFGFTFILWTLVYVAAAVTLGFMRKGKKRDDPAVGLGFVPAEIVQSIGTLWSDPVLRTIFILLGALNLILYGVVSQGILLQVIDRLGGSTVGVAGVYSTFTIGILIGVVLAGVVRRPRRLGMRLLGVMVVVGAITAVMPFLPGLAPLAIANLIVSVCMGYLNVMLIAWAQRHTDPAMMGRVMGLMLLASAGLPSFSTLVVGSISSDTLNAAFMAGGIALVSAALLALTTSAMREGETGG